MSTNRLDDLFRKKLKEREFTPSDAALESMGQMLDQGPSGKGAMRWFVLGLVMLIGAGFWYSQSIETIEPSYVERSDLEQSTSTGSMSVDLNKSVNRDETAEYVSIDYERATSTEELTSEEQDTYVALGQSNEIGERSTNSDSKAPEERSSVSSSSSWNIENRDANFGGKEADEIKGKPADEDSKENSLGASFVPPITSNGQESTAQEANPRTQAKELLLSEGVVSNPETNSKSRKSRDDASGSVMPILTMTESQHLIDQQGQSEAGLDFTEMDLDLLPLLGPTLGGEDLDHDLETAVDSLPAIQNYVKDNRKLTFAIEPFYSFDRISKSLTSSNGEWNSLVNYRSQNESPIWSQSYGLDLLAKRGRIGLTTGFSFVELGEEVEYRNVLTDSTVYEQFEFYEFLDTTFVQYILDTNMVIIDSIVTTEIYDSLLVTGVDSTIFTTSDGRSQSNGLTSLTYIEVPFSFSYGFQIKRWRFEPTVGISFGFLRGYRGTYLGRNEDLVEIGTQELVLKKTIMSMSYGLGLGYDLTDRFSFWTAIRAKRGLDSVLEEKGYEQRYTSNSIRVGLRYSF